MVLFQKPCYGFIESFGDEIRVGEWGFFAACDLDGGDAEVFGELDVNFAVTEHGGSFQIDVEIFAGGFQHACFRFAAVTVCVGSVWAIVDGSEFKAFCGKEFLEAVVDGGEVVFCEITTADAGLVRDENDAVACVAKSLQAIDSAFGEFHSGWIREVFLVDDERVVTINENIVF